MFELAQKYAGIRAETLPDREQLADDLGQLGVAKADRTRLAAAVPTPTALQRAQRHVTAFVAALDADDDLATVEGRPHAQAAAYFASVRAQLGDAPCPAEELSAVDRARVESWIYSRPLASRDYRYLGNATVTPACGAYAWASWIEYPSGGSGIQHEDLLALDAGLTHVLELRSENDGSEMTSHHQDQFFRHGGTTVGMIVHDGRLDVIANSKIVARRKGPFESYMFDPRWSDASDDLAFDPASHAWFHATPTGLEKIDPEPLAAHEARRAALELVRATPPSATPAFLHALALLGAEASLLREIRAL